MGMNDSRDLVVLVVEDVDDTRELMRLALEERGYRVLEAENGEQAVEVALSEHPDVILMDLSLPVLDGLEATERIRQHKEFSTTPIVAVTAHQETDLRADAQASGFTAYVTKPIDFNWLNDLLNDLLALE
ncbi:MAG: two-component system, cell cycle response regulator DivK [Blastocatellia bacterium]|jgi:CheY-like chemotaxis protein|nr:two-component system, cell cycle response regulator DivK [Blastocatellia bacterium]